MFLCQWQSGLFSVIDVPEDSISVLKRAAEHDGMKFLLLPPCRFDFRWNEAGEIELVKVGTHTASFISKHCEESRSPHRTGTKKNDESLEGRPLLAESETEAGFGSLSSC